MESDSDIDGVVWVGAEYGGSGRVEVTEIGDGVLWIRAADFDGVLGGRDAVVQQSVQGLV